MNKPKLFCMVGLSASGKSTIGKEIEKEKVHLESIKELDRDIRLINKENS